ncbi:MAG: DUF4359 domain-containing protein [Cyanobacteria bacterium SID2]|nr:DUF4359 domain-containing protein [Cyanobacteria bacterium SID2]MBP0006461.1 DUF4359 domain-containing protein [Cyanobacteria bacterium SBC]
MKAAVGAGIAILGLGAVMALTNPGESAYENYAEDRLSTYLKEDVCSEAGLLQDPCESLVESSQAELQNLIASNTERQNFLLFSIYRTELSVPIPGVPAIKAQTLGVLTRFHTYELQEET